MQNIISKKKYKIDFAPVQGYTDFIYRRVHAMFFKGIESYFTPFQRIPQRNKDKKDVAPEHNDLSITVPQIIGGDAEEMSFLLNYLKNLGYKRADINFGCPFKMITNRGRGAGCFNDIKRIRTLLNFPEGMDISLKMRLGWDNPSQILEILPYINDAKIYSLTIHARVGIQEYKGDTDPETFEKVYNNCTHP
ncbi:MAG: tRNA-dihydrouridine synthase, partial [Prolixibacteraceae bacterium]|nr:tRNA-dihydrouridine synthase [Prolixibacteraceae bacterium]